MRSWKTVLGHAQGDALADVKAKYKQQAAARKHDPVLLAAAWEAAQKHHGRRTSGRAGARLAAKTALQRQVRPVAALVRQAIHMLERVAAGRDTVNAIAARVSRWRSVQGHLEASHRLGNNQRLLVVANPGPMFDVLRRDGQVEPARFMDVEVHWIKFAPWRSSFIVATIYFDTQRKQWVVVIPDIRDADATNTELRKARRMVWAATQGMLTLGTREYQRTVPPYTMHAPYRTDANVSMARLTIAAAVRARRERYEQLHETFKPGGPGFEAARHRFSKAAQRPRRKRARPNAAHVE